MRYYKALTSPAQKYLANVYPMQRRAPLPAPSSQGIEEQRSLSLSMPWHKSQTGCLFTHLVISHSQVHTRLSKDPKRTDYLRLRPGGDYDTYGDL